MLRSQAVEQIVRENIYSESKNHTPPLKLPPLSLIVLILLSGFMVVNTGAMTLMEYIAPTPSNPFTTYADVFPGQPVSAAEAIGFSCYTIGNNIDGDLFEKHCYSHPDTGAFSSLDILISEGIIRQITFIIRDDTMRIGDLELFLEEKSIHTYFQMVYIYLPGSLVIAKTTGQVGRSYLFVPVWSVSFLDII